MGKIIDPIGIMSSNFTPGGIICKTAKSQRKLPNKDQRDLLQKENSVAGPFVSNEVITVEKPGTFRAEGASKQALPVKQHLK